MKQQTNLEGPDYGPEILRSRLEAIEWRDPEDTDRASSKPKMIKRITANPMRIDAVKIKSITEQHLQAATQLTDDYEMGVLGAKLSRGFMMTARQGFHAGICPADAVIDRLQSYERAMLALGNSLGVVVRFFVLGIPDVGKVDLKTFAAMQGISTQTAKRELLAALDRLVDYYYPNGLELDADDPFARLA
jgi:hypothetical protein